MDSKTSLAYFNELVARFEELFYHELSGCAQNKVELIGADFLKSKKITGDTVEKVIEGCLKEIETAGLCQEIGYSIHGFGILLKLTMKGCIHMPKEIMLKGNGVEPYTCPVANMVLDKILEVSKYIGSYVAEMKIDEEKDECVVKCAIYENVDKIGQVSDWTKI